MFAKLFKKNTAFDPSTLELIAHMEAAQQLLLIDKYLAHCRDNERSAAADEALNSLLATLIHRGAIAKIELEVAKRAIAATQSAETLERLLDLPTLGDIAAKRLCKLLPLDSTDSVNNHQKVFQARLQSANPEEIEQLSRRVATPEQAAWLVVRAPLEAKAELLTLPMLRGEAGLATLEKISRGHDKGCNRLAREKLDGLRESRRLLESHIGSLDGVVASAQRELKIQPKDLDGLIVQRKKLHQLHLRQQQLMTDIDLIQNDLAAVGELGDRYHAAISLFDSLDLSIPSSKDNPIPALLSEADKLAQTVAQLNEEASALVDQLTQDLASLKLAWRDNDAPFPATDAQQKQFANTCLQAEDCLQCWQRLQDVDWPSLANPLANATETPQQPHGLATPKDLIHWLKRARQVEADIAWPSNIAPPTKLATLRCVIEEIVAENKTRGERQQTLTSELTSISNSLQALVNGGKYKKALAGLKKCRALQKQGARGSEKLINQVSAQLGELSDWQQFAASPKRDSLLQAMEAIASTPLNPDNQREQIKDLRSQWIALGPLPKEQRKLQESFDKLADQAFQVCRQHFAEQNQERRENLEARKGLCEQLQQYLDSTDWAAADMKAAENIMRHAREEWRRYHPCDRKTLKAVEERFETLQDALYRHVKTYWDTNVSTKETLVVEAEALVVQESLAGIAAQAKSLQVRWREVGATPRGADQKLWKKFRGACDQIFQRLEDARENQRSEQQQLSQALISEIENFDPDAVPAAEAENQLTNLSNRATELRLDNKYRKVIQGYRDAINRLRSAAHKVAQAERLNNFRQWDEAVSDAEIAGTAMQPPHAFFNHRSPSGALSEDLLGLTMEAEIAADIAGPTDEQNARMALQIDLMNRGKRNMQLVENQQLLQRWCGCGPKSASDHLLRERFFNALAKRLD